jgi:hypothetical protein
MRAELEAPPNTSLVEDARPGSTSDPVRDEEDHQAAWSLEEQQVELTPPFYIFLYVYKCADDDQGTRQYPRFDFGNIK